MSQHLETFCPSCTFGLTVHTAGEIFRKVRLSGEGQLAQARSCGPVKSVLLANQSKWESMLAAFRQCRSTFEIHIFCRFSLRQ